MERIGGLLTVLLSLTLLTCCSNRTADTDSPEEQGKNEKKGLTVIRVTKVARMTGKPVAGEDIPSPNNTGRDYDVGGTDLGIYWKMGEGKVGILFGDTFGRDWAPGYTPNWRSNVMAWSTDTDLSDGLTFDGMITEPAGVAKQIIYSAHITTGFDDWSSIPTAAIRIGNRDYVHYMNVRAWNPRWETNWSGFAVSADNGQNWTLHKGLFSSDSKFAQMALWEKDGYVYSMGSIIGRRGLPYIARFKEQDILTPDKWEYWNVTYGWQVGKAAYASPLFGNTKDQMYAEPTLIYHDHFQKWITVYYNEIRNRIVLRSADEITGPWSDEQLVASGSDYPMPYGGFIYPLNLDKPEIYISLSQWDPLYNVFLMKVELKNNK